MNWALVLAFLFAVGASFGWCLEFVFRNLISHKGPKGILFINPGFCRGPYLPIYGVGMDVMFVLAYIMTSADSSLPAIYTILAIGIAMTLIEFVGGFFLLKVLNIRLWDYTKRPGNILGLVCPLFSLIWAVLGAIYYLFIHPLAIDGLIWLSHNLAFSFMIGLFFGFFIIDMFVACRDAGAIKEFGDDHDVIVKYEELKALVQEHRMAKSEKRRFFNQVSAENLGIMDFLLSHNEISNSKH